MDLLYPVKKVREKLAERRGKKKQKDADEKLIEKWKSQFEVDWREKKAWDDRIDQWEAMYAGNREFENLENPAVASDKKVRTIVNFPRMVVESLIDLNVPDPYFKAVAKDDEQAVEQLRNYVSFVVRSSKPSIKEINLTGERRVMKNGIEFPKVHWDNSIKKAGYVGAVTLSSAHAKDIIPNKGATTLEDMEHYHHPVNRTAKYIKRKWPNITDKDLEKATLHREFDEMYDTQKITVDGSSDGGEEMGLDKYTIVETTYRDEDWDICKLWWSGDLPINHIPKFFYRRDENGGIMYTETLELQTEFGPVAQEVEYYVPTCWDIVYWPFITRDKCFWPFSMMEDIWDIQESIKKAIYKYEEEFLRGNKKILTGSPDIAEKLEDPAKLIVYVPDPQNTKDVNLSSGLDGLAWIEKLKEWLQLTTGSTNAFLGVHDPGVHSGDQAEAYIEQGNFKVQLKSAFKSIAFEQLYRVIADFTMAFADGDRAWRLLGDRDIEIYGTFNRLNLLRDMSGNLVYPDFDVEISAEAGFMKSKSQIFNGIVMLANNRAFDPTPGNLRFLKILDKLGVPNLKDAIGSMESDIAEQKELAKLKAQMEAAAASAGPDVNRGFLGGAA